MPESNAVLIHSGSEQFYYADDQAIAYRAFGHFSHWLPIDRPDQFVLMQPDKRPIYFQVVPKDFWFDQSITNDNWWSDHFDIVELATVAEIKAHLPKSTTTYIGANKIMAQSLGISQAQINPERLLNFLNYQRAFKTDYEILQLRIANKLALAGHQAAKQCFLANGNEFEVHKAFLNACAILEEETPYTNIVAIDEKSAILHYQHKRRVDQSNSRVLLIDAGCRVNGYCSDITRTSCKPQAHEIFQSLVAAMDTLKLSLIATIKPGMPYPQLQEAALQSIAEILLEHKICSGDAERLMADKIPHKFMPHGVGHLLGIQVHDVGGHQIDIDGHQQAPPEDSPALRNTRLIQENMVFTIEPGLYFIPMLLDPERSSKQGNAIDWKLIEDLIPLGGIRSEDNVRVTKDSAENLTATNP